MEPGKVVFKGQVKNGEEVIIRYPQASDTQQMLEYINVLSAEKTFILFQGEQLTFEQEAAYLTSVLEGMKVHKKTELLAFINDQLVAVSGIGMQDKARKHLGVFGISVAKEFRGVGLGSLMMKLILEEAKQLEGLKIIVLGVFGDNPVAKHLYQKFGFKEFGNLPGGVLHDGVSVDHSDMYKVVED